MSNHFNDYFFHSSNYHLINSGSTIEKITINQSVFHLVVQNLSAYSAFKTSFGTITGNPNSLDVKKLLDRLKGRVLKIYYSLPPLLFPYASESLSALLDAGFKMKSVEISQQINLDQEFQDRLHYSKRKKLKKLDSKDLKTKKLGLESFDACFSLIEKNRFLTGHPLTMKRESLRKLLVHFPEEYLLFGTFKGDELVACSVSINLGYSILYHFYWADDPDKRPQDSLLHLNNFTYYYAKEKGFKVIDFGVSSVNGKINRGLFRFKQQLGATTTKKYYLEYYYS